MTSDQDKRQIMKDLAGGNVEGIDAIQPEQEYANFDDFVNRSSRTTGSKHYRRWVIKTAKGLISDAHVRDNSKLGVVISSEIQPNEVKPLTQSLVQGFRKNFPDRNLSVLVYAPDKQPLLAAHYDNRTRQIEYQ